MNRGRRTALCIVGAACISLLVFLSGCSLFNEPPVGRISTSAVSGTSPLVVSFDASESDDADGVIVAYHWDFDDGETAEGVTTQHVFVATSQAIAYTVTLTVTDDDGARSQVAQTIEARPRDENGEVDGDEGSPTARLNADRTIGLVPLTVTFDARDSTAGSGSIRAFDWDFGDGAKATGPRVSHTFQPEETESFTVTLLVRDDTGLPDAEEVEITAIVPDDVTDDEDPRAVMDVSEPDQIYVSDNLPSVPSLFEVSFDPRGSYADAGHQVSYYAWDFGDGTTQVETTDLVVTHIYESVTPFRTLRARLTVYDDQGLEDTAVANITLVHEEEDEEDE